MKKTSEEKFIGEYCPDGYEICNEAFEEYRKLFKENTSLREENEKLKEKNMELHAELSESKQEDACRNKDIEKLRALVGELVRELESVRHGALCMCHLNEYCYGCNIIKPLLRRAREVVR